MSISPMTLGHEIDISDEQSLQLVIDFLEKYRSDSLRLWQFLKNIQENKIEKDYLRPHQLFVNDRNNLKCVLFICSSVAFYDNYHLLTENDKSKTKNVSFFSNEEDDHLLMSLIKQCISWSIVEDIVFFAFSSRVLPLIQNFIQENNLGKTMFWPFEQLELDQETFLQKTKNISLSTPSDIIIQPLSPSDASIVNSFWAYKSDSSLNLIKYEISHFPAYGAYRNGELLSWSMGKHDGSIGTVFTKPEARGLGLATLVNYYVTSKVFQQQQRAFCFVASDNTASLKIYEKLGFSHAYDVDYLEFSSK